MATTTATEAGQATAELTELLAQQERLEARAGEIAAEERAATAGAQQASDRLVELERSAAAGARISQAKREQAEERLLQARVKALAPWSERKRAAQLAAEDGRLAVSAFVGQHLDDLLRDLEAEGQAAAQALDQAAQAVVDAAHARADVEQRTFALLSMVHRVRPGDVQRARGDQLAAEAERLLHGGGELPPAVLHRPGQPRHGEPATEQAVPA